MAMVTSFNSVHKRLESPPPCGGRQRETISRLPRRSHDLLIQAINEWNREPHKWTKPYFYNFRYSGD